MGFFFLYVTDAQLTRKAGVNCKITRIFALFPFFSHPSRPYAAAAWLVAPPTASQPRSSLPLPKSVSSWATATATAAAAAALHQVPRASPISSPAKSAQQVFPPPFSSLFACCAKPSSQTTSSYLDVSAEFARVGLLENEI